MHVVSNVTVTEPLPNATPATNPFLDLNLNMSLNHVTSVHDDTHNVKHHILDTLHELMLLKQVRQIIISHDMLQV